MMLPALAGAAALVLAGCSNDDDSGSSAADAGSEASRAAAGPDASADEEVSPAAAPKEVEVTPPGTKLKFGERAVVPFSNGVGADGHIGITVTGVSDVDKAAFDAALSDKSDPDITPFCIEYTIENADGSDLRYTYPPSLRGVIADGGHPGAMVFGAKVAGCERGAAPDEFTEAGATYETGQVEGAAPGATVAGAEYGGADYEDRPIVWMP
jgi:hypothetical protein